jgi:hypothetical protein
MFHKLFQFSMTGGAILVGLASFSLLPAQALTFDAADDFSPANNPNSAWQYGSSNTLGGALNLYSLNTPYSGLNAWSLQPLLFSRQFHRDSFV